MRFIHIHSSSSITLRLTKKSNFDNAVSRVKYWTAERHLQGTTSPASSTISPSSSTGQLVGVNATPISANTLDTSSATVGVPNLTSSQRKRIKSYLKRCRLNPRHSQLNLEGYLLLPVQRIPRYRLLVRNFHFDTLLQVHVAVSWRSWQGVPHLVMSSKMILWSERWWRYRLLRII